MEFLNKSDTITVVIATLGNDCLKETIFNLNNGSIKPNEILICIPKEYKERVISFKSNNIKILLTNAFGQVNQRLHGFKNARSEYILQLDDDVILDHNCLSNLLKDIKKYHNCSVGPKLYNYKTQKYYSFIVDDSYQKPSRLINYLSFSNKILIEGSISKSGVNFGLNENSKYTYVEWLPGGCILHKRINLILNNFYPFSGKAYLEDLYHSKLLQLNKVNLIRSQNAICYLNDNDNFISQRFNINDFYKIIKIRVHFAKLYNYDLNRLFFIQLWLFFRLLKKNNI